MDLQDRTHRLEKAIDMKENEIQSLQIKAVDYQVAMPLLRTQFVPELFQLRSDYASLLNRFECARSHSRQYAISLDHASDRIETLQDEMDDMRMEMSEIERRINAKNEGKDSSS